jgi:tripartite-type tricarboxylate transporter receptor subunit TctC
VCSIKAPRLHHAARRRGGSLAARGAGAAGDASDSADPFADRLRAFRQGLKETLESTAKGQIDGGNVRILAQWGTERLPNFPHVPTLQEAGYPDVIYILWTGVFAPAKTPAHVTRILRDAIRPFLQDKAVIERFVKAGSQVSYLDGPEFARFLEADTDRLLKVVRKIGLS